MDASTASKQLRQEFTETHGNAEPFGYWQDHGPRWNIAYVKWLEGLVIASRHRPDLESHDDTNCCAPYYPEV